MIVADVIAALAAFLEADADVAALAGPRVFGDELPPAEAASMPRHAVVIRPSGGASLTAGSYAEHDSQRVDVFSYGATPYEANRLDRTVMGALKQLRRAVAANVLIHWAEPAGGLSAERDPDAIWPRAFRPYQVFFAEQAAA